MKKTFGLAVLALSIPALAGCAENIGTAPARQLVEARASPFAPKAPAVMGRDGLDASRSCSNENPNIEYRDCVNALTRDANAKIRMG